MYQFYKAIVETQIDIRPAILSNFVKTMAYLDNILCHIHLNKMGCQNERITLWLKLFKACLQQLNCHIHFVLRLLLQLVTFKTIVTHPSFLTKHHLKYRQACNLICVIFVFLDAVHMNMCQMRNDKSLIQKHRNRFCWIWRTIWY